MTATIWTNFADEIRVKLETHPDLARFRVRTTQDDLEDVLANSKASATRGEIWIGYEGRESEEGAVNPPGVDYIRSDSFRLTLIDSRRKAAAIFEAAVAAVETCLVGVRLTGADEPCVIVDDWEDVSESTADTRQAVTCVLAVEWDDVRAT